MREADPTEREAALQAVIDRQEDYIAVLERAMGLLTLPPVEWGLTGHEARLFGAVLERELITKDAGMAALYRDRGAVDEPEIKIVDVFICKLRRKLKPFGIEIGTRWGVGYYMTAEAKAAARAQIEAASAHASTGAAAGAVACRRPRCRSAWNPARGRSWTATIRRRPCIAA